MTVHQLTEKDSIANQYLSELRDVRQQQNRHRFRENLTRLGEIMAYEISKVLPFEMKEVQTPLGTKQVRTLKEHPVLITVLRAGVPFFNGFQYLFDEADAGFIGSYRKEGGQTITIYSGYRATPSVAGRVVILIDTMLATGRSLADAIAGITAQGQPSHIHMANVIAAPEGIRYLEENTKVPLTLWTFAIDDRLNSDYYIVPGLGDAGDLSYGSKT